MIVEGLHKLSVFMMCDLFDHFDLRNGYDTELIRTAISTNHLWALEVAYPGLLNEFEVPEETVFINETACLFKKLQRTYHTFSDSEKDKLFTAIPNFSLTHDLAFQGFDSISERNMLDVSKILTLLGYHSDMDLTKETYNATTQRYTRMLDLVILPGQENDPSGVFSLELFCKIILAGR
ncbi:hypothetical protein ACHHY8_01590 [Enterobacter cloacae complex sp. 2024EL-00215]|uniref:Uncharacterized protein n=1 Tax=Enterobacter mori TaxID=539813 RepID=A0A7T0H1P6_9ENTR|nr:hypothetical protein [Enterobacter mori]QPK01450.1 hypothetical protein IDM36_04755 [Enterobacter mori]